MQCSTGDYETVSATGAFVATPAVAMTCRLKVCAKDVQSRTAAPYLIFPRVLSSDGQSWPAAAADVFTLGIHSPSVVGAAYSVEFKRLPQVPTSDSFHPPTDSLLAGGRHLGHVPVEGAECGSDD